MASKDAVHFDVETAVAFTLVLRAPVHPLCVQQIGCFMSHSVAEN
jgi:hypothetical protein